jgi:hypothetical protein
VKKKDPKCNKAWFPWEEDIIDFDLDPPPASCPFEDDKYVEQWLKIATEEDDSPDVPCKKMRGLEQRCPAKRDADVEVKKSHVEKRSWPFIASFIAWVTRIEVRVKALKNIGSTLRATFLKVAKDKSFLKFAKLANRQRRHLSNAKGSQMDDGK